MRGVVVSHLICIQKAPGSIPGASICPYVPGLVFELWPRYASLQLPLSASLVLGAILARCPARNRERSDTGGLARQDATAENERNHRTSGGIPTITLLKGYQLVRANNLSIYLKHIIDDFSPQHKALLHESELPLMAVRESCPTNSLLNGQAEVILATRRRLGYGLERAEVLLEEREHTVTRITVEAKVSLMVT